MARQEIPQKYVDLPPRLPRSPCICVYDGMLHWPAKEIPQNYVGPPLPAHNPEHVCVMMVGRIGPPGKFCKRMLVYEGADKVRSDFWQVRDGTGALRTRLSTTLLALGGEQTPPWRRRRASGVLASLLNHSDAARLSLTPSSACPFLLCAGKP